MLMLEVLVDVFYWCLGRAQGGLKPQSAEQGEFTDLEGLDLQTKLGLLRKNEHWKCQVKQEALQVKS